MVGATTCYYCCVTHHICFDSLRNDRPFLGSIAGSLCKRCFCLISFPLILFLLLYLLLFSQSLLSYHNSNPQKEGGKNTTQQRGLFPFLFRLSDPCFCCVTDDFNYLLTPCTQQIHMINGVGDGCSHHLDGAKECK